MSGRRRRASTSSVETVDGDKIRWLQESNVVRSQPKDVHKDNYPCLELRNATVYDRKGEVLENALDVAVRGPYIVRGYLIMEDASDRRLLIMKVRSSTPIEIRQCIAYSIGEAPGARPLVWALGRGAWYEINPSEAYRPIFNKMCEATTMYYNLVDIYNSKRLSQIPKASGSGLLEALHDDFLQYAMKTGDGATFNEVLERCAEHAIFLVCQFTQESLELIDWKQTPFYKWFTIEHADVVHKTMVALKNPRKARSPSPRERASPAPSNRSSSRIARSVSMDKVDSDQIQLSRRSKPASNMDVATPNITVQQPAIHTQSADAATTTAHEDQTPFASVLSAVEEICEQRVGSKRGISGTTTLNTLYFDYKFPMWKDGSAGSHKIPVQEVLHYNAAALLQNLDKDRFQALQLWSYLEELAEKPFNPRAIKISEFPYRLVRRDKTQRSSKQPVPSAVEGESSPRETDDSPRPIGKTVKRPGRRPGKTSSLRTVASSKKRTFAEIGDDSEPDSESSGLKRSHYFSDREEEQEEDVSMQESTVAHIPRDAVQAAPLRPENLEPIQIVIRTEKIPSTVPRGPGDAWTCDQDDCTYVVRGGDADGCQARIQKHFEEHQEQTKRLNLAVTESSRGHMPIKYAYFPPFLILVEFPPPTDTAKTAAPNVDPRPDSLNSLPPSLSSSSINTTHSSHSSNPTTIEAFPSPSPPPNGIPDLSGSAKESFRQLVDTFRRRPQPVSDRIASLTLLQSFTRETQTDGRKNAAACHIGRDDAAADQEETDSMTLQLDDDE
ncbi:hypothetical protein TGAM01_v200563 [Trichoderma gamsii]|uniref:DNA (cytosine-5)-methyltransferase 1 replication foci domain-containing protein n=1 Tax=Trichoderma gamsii TaxID=398673 RepID=A0A2P5A0T1_9HYPO|nr:hypothetical protein TGAM01_v200563 [Trichoderma gamsii]PON30123.1 hypothetical protein TGAM01_v200563 [Trichoderma gamsii]